MDIEMKDVEQFENNYSNPHLNHTKISNGNKSYINQNFENNNINDNLLQQKLKSNSINQSSSISNGKINYNQYDRFDQNDQSDKNNQYNLFGQYDDQFNSYNPYDQNRISSEFTLDFQENDVVMEDAFINRNAISSRLNLKTFKGNLLHTKTPSHGQLNSKESFSFYLQSVILNFLNHLNYTHIDQYAFDLLQYIIPSFIESIGNETHRHVSSSRRTAANTIDILHVLESIGFNFHSLLDEIYNNTESDDLFQEESYFQNSMNTKSYIIGDEIQNAQVSDSSDSFKMLYFLPPLPESYTYKNTEHIPPPRKFDEATLRREVQEIEISLTDIYMAQTSMKSLHFEDQYDRESKLLMSSEIRSRSANGSIISSRPIVNPYLPSHLKNQVRIHIADVASQQIETSDLNIKLIPPLVKIRDHLEHMSRWKLPKHWGEFQRKCDPAMRSVQQILRFQNPQMR